MTFERGEGKLGTKGGWMDGQRELHTRPPPGGMPEPLRIWLIGGFRVTVGSREVGAELTRRRKVGSLVKMLALARGHALRREEITGLLWPGMGARSAANNLYGVLHAARRALDPSSGAAPDRYLTLRDDLVELRAGGGLWVDVVAFEEAASIARRSREPAAYRAAIELNPGDLLTEDLYEAWAEERRGELRRVRHDLLVELADLHEERQEYGPAVEALERAVAEEPLDEAAHLRLMRLYAADSRDDEALHQYERLRRTLSEGLGAEPTEAGRDLYEAIRAGRYPKLSPRSAAGSSGPRVAGSNLPVQLTSFVGREEELLGVRRALWMTGLLTLTGTGGAGKTRLALEAAGGLAVAPTGWGKDRRGRALWRAVARF